MHIYFTILRIALKKDCQEQSEKLHQSTNSQFRVTRISDGFLNCSLALSFKNIIIYTRDEDSLTELLRNQYFPLFFHLLERVLRIMFYKQSNKITGRHQIDRSHAVKEHRAYTKRRLVLL